MHVGPGTIRLILPVLLLCGALAGCGGRTTIPSGAQNVATGSGKLRYTASENGDIYLLDADANKKVFEGKVRRGDQMIVDPSQDRIVVAGDNADHTPALRPEHRYRIYFDPTR